MNTPMQQAGQDPTGTLSKALDAATQLLGTDPVLAEKRASAILKSVPGQQHALMLLVSARLAQGDAGGARAVLELAAGAQPKLAAVHYELGLLLGELGETGAAIAALSRVVELEPEHPSAWRTLGDTLAETGRAAEAAQAYANHFRSALNDLKFVEDAAVLASEQAAMAEGMLNAFLEIHPTDVSAIHMLAKVLLQQGRVDEAGRLFARALELAPGFATLRLEYVHLLLQEKDPEEASRQIDILLGEAPNHLAYRALKAAALYLAGELQPAIACHEAIVRENPGRARVWLTYGQVLKTAGRQEESVAAFRKSIALEPGSGVAWWNLANLKIFRFTSAEIEAMRFQLRRHDLAPDDRLHLLFAVGKALEDREAYAESFEHYRLGNELGRSRFSYDPDEASQLVRRFKAFLNREFFDARAGLGCRSADPIFIVGLPRSGSTLVEQILSSHSEIEGTTELPDIIAIANRLNRRAGSAADSSYPEILGALDAAELSELGREFLKRTRIQRKLGKPFFIDKMPNNFQHLGLIRLILPNAKIIDARRHPLGCGFSIYKHCFPVGVKYTYDLSDTGRYYRDYVELMAHFDAVLPGFVHRVLYEDMIRNPAKEVRRLLEFCGVPFEEACLRFYETKRGVRTASSEQVRRPIYTEALEQWRHYETWLDPLKAALGPVLDAFPAVPAFRGCDETRQ